MSSPSYERSSKCAIDCIFLAPCDDSYSHWCEIEFIIYMMNIVSCSDYMRAVT